MFDLLKDFAGFLAKRKKFWLAPIIIVMILLGVLVVFAQGSAVAPFYLYLILSKAPALAIYVLEIHLRRF